jgi:hypothetical protein
MSYVCLEGRNAGSILKKEKIIRFSLFFSQPAACVVCALPNQNGFYFGLLVGLNGQVQTIQLSKERIALYSWLFDEVESIRRAICCDSPQTLHKGWQVWRGVFDWELFVIKKKKKGSKTCCFSLA